MTISHKQNALSSYGPLYDISKCRLLIPDSSQDSEEDDLPLDKIIPNASNPQPQEIPPINSTNVGAGPPTVETANNESSKALPGEQYFI